MPTVTIFGASGFIGRSVLRRLSRSPAAASLSVRVVSRQGAIDPLLAPRVALEAIRADICNPAAVAVAVQGADAVVNCVGVLYETKAKGITFDNVQGRGPAVIADAVRDGKACKRLVHVSAIGADAASKSAYARTKAAGEVEALRVAGESDAQVTVLRPSIVFGPEDSFFNRFNDLARFMPFLPLVGGGTTKFQPVHVDDVAEAIVSSLGLVTESKDASQIDGRDSEKASVYELGGADILTFRELMELVLTVSGKRRLLVPIPFAVADVQGLAFEALHNSFPQIAPMLTRDQVELLRSDNIVAYGAKTLADLGIAAKPCNISTVSYLRKDT